MRLTLIMRPVEHGTSAVSREQGARPGSRECAAQWGGTAKSHRNPRQLRCWSGLATGPRNECYTAPLATMSDAFRSKLLSIAVMMMIFLASATAQEAPNPFTPQAVQLVTEIMNRAASPGFVTIDVQNRSSLSASDVALARKALEAQLRSSGARLVKPERAVSEITVTISENVQGLLWVAEVRQGPISQSIMVQGANAAALTPSHLPTLTLRRALVYSASNDEPMLDFVLADPKILYVLRSQNITAYKWDGARWWLLNAFNFDRLAPIPRDPRGHLVWQPSQLVAYLPGAQCTAPLASDGLLQGIQCRDIDDPWPLDNSFNAFFSSTRNFFSGIVRGANFNSAVKSVEASVPPFYSASAIGEANALWVFAGTDGRARLYSSFTQAPRVYSGWGSELASIHSGCGSQWQLLISKHGDRSQPDAVQAMEIANGEPVPVSATLEISGAMTSMRHSSDGTSANMISRDPATGKYEASILSVDCR